jgi:hypothetical protein
MLYDAEFVSVELYNLKHDSPKAEKLATSQELFPTTWLTEYTRKAL